MKRMVELPLKSGWKFAFTEHLSLVERPGEEPDLRLFHEPVSTEEFEAGMRLACTFDQAVTRINDALES